MSQAQFAKEQFTSFVVRVAQAVEPTLDDYRQWLVTQAALSVWKRWGMKASLAKVAKLMRGQDDPRAVDLGRMLAAA